MSGAYRAIAPAPVVHVGDLIGQCDLELAFHLNSKLWWGKHKAAQGITKSGRGKLHSISFHPTKDSRLVMGFLVAP